jgi:predicted nucleic acid-binding protein
MSILFVDSSALVKRYQEEEGSDRVSELTENAHGLLIARLTIVEVSSALVRRAKATSLPSSDVEAILSLLDRDVAEAFKIVELEQPAMNRAVELARIHGLR